MSSPSCKDTGDLRFLPLSVTFRKDSHFHSVQMICSIHLILRDIKVLFPAFNLYKAKALLMAGKNSGKQLLLRFGIPSSFINLNLALCKKLLQNSF